jgi:hypothetical protein
MTLEFTHQYAHSIATRVLQFLRTNLTSSFAAFFNTETLARKVHDAVKKALTGTSWFMALKMRLRSITTLELFARTTWKVSTFEALSSRQLVTLG